MTGKDLNKLFAQTKHCLARSEPLAALNLLDTINAPHPATYRPPHSVSSRSRTTNEHQNDLTPDEFLVLQVLRFQAYDMIYLTAANKTERDNAYVLAREAIRYVMMHHQGRYQKLHKRYQEHYEPKARITIKVGKARARQQRRDRRRALRQNAQARKILFVPALVTIVLVVALLTVLTFLKDIISPPANPTALLVSASATMALIPTPTLATGLEIIATELSRTAISTTSSELPPTSAPLSTSPVQTAIAIAEASDILIRPDETFNPASLRFYRLPIRVYARSLDVEWNTALTAALAQAQQVVPITRVLSAAQADITVEVVSEATYATQDCPLTEETLGCGWIIAVRQNSDSTRVDAYDYRGFVRIVETAPNPLGLMLHELLHTLGLHHSDIRGDIMFPFFGQQTTMSDHDLALLFALYRQ